jgi:hypothetical protein
VTSIHERRFSRVPSLLSPHPKASQESRWPTIRKIANTSPGEHSRPRSEQTTTDTMRANVQFSKSIFFAQLNLELTHLSAVQDQGGTRLRVGSRGRTAVGWLPRLATLACSFRRLRRSVKNGSREPAVQRHGDPGVLLAPEVPIASSVDGGHVTPHFCNLFITDQTSWSECS